MIAARILLQIIIVKISLTPGNRSFGPLRKFNSQCSIFNEQFRILSLVVKLIELSVDDQELCILKLPFSFCTFCGPAKHHNIPVK